MRAFTYVCRLCIFRLDGQIFNLATFVWKKKSNATSILEDDLKNLHKGFGRKYEKMGLYSKTASSPAIPKRAHRQTEIFIKIDQSWFAITIPLNSDPKESCAKT